MIPSFKTSNSPLKNLVAMALIGAGCLSGAAVQAATGTPAHGSAMAAGGGCNANEAANDPAACKRESGAAAQAAKRGNLTSPGAAAAQNTTDRCSSLTGAQKKDCMARAGSSPTSASGTTTSEGSVQSGGIIKETVTPVPAKP